MFYHDPEVPAGYQEADILQAQYEDESRAAAALRKRGVCTHSWMLGAGHSYTLRDVEEMRKRGDFPERRIDEEDIADVLDPPTGKALCLNCGQIMDDLLARR